MTDVSQRLDLPVGSIGRRANGWWGMMMLIVTAGLSSSISCSLIIMQRFSTAETGCLRIFRISSSRSLIRSFCF